MVGLEKGVKDQADCVFSHFLGNNHSFSYAAEPNINFSFRDGMADLRAKYKVELKKLLL